MAKSARTSYDWLAAVSLTAILHLLVIKTAALPPGNYFFPFVEEFRQEVTQTAVTGTRETPASEAAAAITESTQTTTTAGNEAIGVIPYERTPQHGAVAGLTNQAVPPLVSFLPTAISKNGDFRSLLRQNPVTTLSPPRFSASTIPAKPKKSLGQEAADDAETILLGNVFQDAVPATGGFAAMLQAEEAFLKTLRRDITDGRLDMPFADFILAAEYYHLSRAMMPLGQQPSFTLEEAMDRYRRRLERVGEGMPKEIDAYWLIMLLQRYAENKFYPENGSGMFLDALFHSQNDCEGGTKEILAYLQALYPTLRLGSNRGMLQTTSGQLVGHIQVFIGPGRESGKILENAQGLIVETTRIGRDSVLPYSSGDVFPLEDFVVRYYPQIVAGTPLATGAGKETSLDGDAAGRIVGTSNHPLKMGYGASTTLLAAQFYDLANIRTQRIDNEFLRSDIPNCNPRIDPAKIDRTNLFSNFVTIDRKLRRTLVGHYLADLQYWDNHIMPQWRQPNFLATYEDLAGNLLAGDDGATGYLQVDAENSIPLSSLQSHGRLLRNLRDDDGNKNHFLTTGRRECGGRTVLDDKLLRFLFTAPEGPGLFFLPAPDENLEWSGFLDNIVHDCLAVPAATGKAPLLRALEEESAGHQTSFRKALYVQATNRGLAPASLRDPLSATTKTLSQLLSGGGDDAHDLDFLGKRSSPESTPGEPSVEETLVEQGRTGINGGLLGDLVDFLGSAETASILKQYAGRSDLRLTVHRAQELMAQVTSLFEPGDTVVLLNELQTANDVHLRLAAAMNLARIKGLSAIEISRPALDSLQNSKVFRAEHLVALLQYGLLPNDAAGFLRGQVSKHLARLTTLETRQGDADDSRQMFRELIEIIRTLPHLPDKDLRQALQGGLGSSLEKDFAYKTAGGDLNKTMPDWGLPFNKLMLLSLLHETGNEEQGRAPSLAWLQHYVRFAAANPIGKLMLGPVEKIAGDDGIAVLLSTTLAEQQGALNRLQQGDAPSAESLRTLATLLGEGNIIARMLLSADIKLVAQLSGLAPEHFSDQPKRRAAWYVEKLHRRIVPLLGNADMGKKTSTDHPPLLDFYNNGMVRESFALLAYLQEEQGDNGNGVKFRKTQDLAAIKNPSTLRVIEGERKITRQDMSLLTLALNAGNQPTSLRRAWEDTLAVTNKHLGIKNLDQGLRGYLFAPHYPYLTENDSGFFFAPDTIEDLHNAASWGGRNDILLSSYLHFRNLPAQLPDWLRRTAMARSELELAIIKKFEQQSFLPMILECDSDNKELPEPLFRAKWAIRKPFGEDIFPGTLLLLRLGYLEITDAGDIIRTAKYQGG